MSQYRKQSVVEAFQMTRERRMDNSEWPEWLNEAWNKNEGEEGAVFRQNTDAPLPDLLCIWTLEGVHLVNWDDWIIRGVAGELYPCRPDIFAQTYEPTKEEQLREYVSMLRKDGWPDLARAIELHHGIVPPADEDRLL
jgi:hypothetical protein